MSWAIWITGLPGSGKSALARAAAANLGAAGEPVRVLELDEIRKTLTPSPDYSDAERDVVYRALVYMATVVTEMGTPVIIDATAHRRAWRDLARAEIRRFAEVQLVCPPELCRRRERTRPPGHAPRGIYAGADQPGATVPGANVAYEPVAAPDLVIDTGRENVAEGAARIVKLAQSLAQGSPSEPRAVSNGWAIWITGRPGSGKTALAERVAAAVAARGVPIKMLELGALRHFLVHDGAASAREHEIGHRALAYAAKLLTEAGVAVIVDATAKRRAWREAARELIPRFAEVQLLCPAETCMEREQAVRWRLGGSLPGPRVIDPTPDICVDYEESLRPELALRTDLHDLWSTVEQVLFLVHRLGRMTPPQPGQA